MRHLIELRNIINEAIKMHQLNVELLEQLDVACKWLLENKIQVPNRGKFISLLNKADALLNEIYLTQSKQQTNFYSVIEQTKS